jgi:hypothetical protein
MISPEKTKTGVHIFFSFFFFSFLFVLLFLFFSFCFFSFKKIFEVGQGGVLPFFHPVQVWIWVGTSEFSEMCLFESLPEVMLQMIREGSGMSRDLSLLFSNR